MSTFVKGRSLISGLDAGLEGKVCVCEAAGLRPQESQRSGRAWLSAYRSPRAVHYADAPLSQTDPAGDTFALDGTVAGFFS